MREAVTALANTAAEGEIAVRKLVESGAVQSVRAEVRAHPFLALCLAAGIGHGLGFVVSRIFRPTAKPDRYRNLFYAE